jgi:hypothetical protein
MRRISIAVAVAAALVSVSSGVGRVKAHDDGRQELRQLLSETLSAMGANAQRLRVLSFEARLAGNNEVPPVSTTGTGRFEALLVPELNVLAYRLTYANLEGGVAPVTPLVAHVHFAPTKVNGGVMFFLCGGGGKPPCPPQPAVVTGTVTATPTDITGPNAQGIAPGEFEAVERALRAEIAYANVHTSTWPAGEIRGQVRKD